MSDVAKHTPGPWRVGPETTEGYYIDAGPYSVGLAIDGLDAVHANARLIAAAPELLAACKALYATHKPGMGQCCEAADMAIAAIAKAEDQ